MVLYHNKHNTILVTDTFLYGFPSVIGSPCDWILLWDINQSVLPFFPDDICSTHWDVSPYGYYDIKPGYR